MNKAAANSPTLNTAFLLMAQYGGKAVIPVEDVCRDYSSHLDPAKFIRKVGAGEIAIPLVRMEPSQKCAKGVHLQDLADYLDARRAVALKGYRQLAELGTTKILHGLFSPFLKMQKPLCCNDNFDSSSFNPSNGRQSVG
jgi:hypothetical protein